MSETCFEITRYGDEGQLWYIVLTDGVTRLHNMGEPMLKDEAIEVAHSFADRFGVPVIDDSTGEEC